MQDLNLVYYICIMQAQYLLEDTHRYVHGMVLPSNACKPLNQPLFTSSDQQTCITVHKESYTIDSSPSGLTRVIVSRMAGRPHRNSLVEAWLCLILATLSTAQGRRLSHAAALGDPDTVEAYTCVGSGALQHPCSVNPAYTFAVGFHADSHNLADR